MNPKTLENKKQYFPEQIKEFYKKGAKHYNKWGLLFETKTKQLCMDRAALKDGEAFLDVGVGSGHFFIEAIKLNKNGINVGIDLTPSMLEQAKITCEQQGLHNWELKLGNAYMLEEKSGSYDVIVCTYLFELLPVKDYGQILAGFKRVLKPGGRIVLAGVTPAKYWYHYLAEWLCHKNPIWLNGFNSEIILKELVRLGFKNLSCESVTQLTFPSDIIYGECV